ncbi:hypothetical protein [Kibdelosporangium phytohabitans]|uniref:ATP-grasp domain-containing protein n=1 Tax=Kibdelosporangium phytohabitans TaxID=860235 RepID=A0A0N9HUT5_9PSEU|nr:hypothetical protein [Kibdelosporangium phytohabitans]ALG06662.1 hypothetical protein AOZ06_06745 [Kibdelosporangium phytohabitans]MBE1467875.1 hypothetical protein [Kibdelosporangium phytohabitans]
MTAARLGTFDAEKWWRPTDLATLPAVARAGSGDAVAAMDELLAGFCAPGDRLLTRHPMAGPVRAGLAAAGITFEHLTVDGSDEPYERNVSRELVGGFAVEPYAVLAETARLSDSLPDNVVVAGVNSKAWSNALALSMDLPGTGVVVRSVAELSAAVARFPSAIVKDPYGVSGRAALVVESSGVLRAIERTLTKQDKRIELLVQRRYDVGRDFSAHVLIEPDGTWWHRGVQVMTNRGLRHLGSSPATPEFIELLWEKSYFEVVSAVAGKLAATGYHGPFGVDSMLLRDGTLVPVLEINARQSLGLLSFVLHERAAKQGLAAHLSQLELTIPPGSGISSVCQALAEIRYTGGEREGVLVLNGSTLAAPGGRVYLALFSQQPDALRQRALNAVTAAGMTVRGGAHAA